MSFSTDQSMIHQYGKPNGIEIGRRKMYEISELDASSGQVVLYRIKNLCEGPTILGSFQQSNDPDLICFFKN